MFRNRYKQKFSSDRVSNWPSRVLKCTPLCTVFYSINLAVVDVTKPYKRGFKKSQMIWRSAKIKMTRTCTHWQALDRFLSSFSVMPLTPARQGSGDPLPANYGRTLNLPGLDCHIPIIYAFCCTTTILYTEYVNGNYPIRLMTFVVQSLLSFPLDWGTNSDGVCDSIYNHYVSEWLSSQLP